MDAVRGKRRPGDRRSGSMRAAAASTCFDGTKLVRNGRLIYHLGTTPSESDGIHAQPHLERKHNETSITQFRPFAAHRWCRPRLKALGRFAY
jgi:hypothetical protein